jgi:hypothetical protein
MKLALWMYSVAVGFSSLLILTLGGLFQNIFRHRFGNKPLPPLTDFFIHLQWWALLPVGFK